MKAKIYMRLFQVACLLATLFMLYGCYAHVSPYGAGMGVY